MYVSDLYQFFPKSSSFYAEITHESTKEFVVNAIYTFFKFLLPYFSIDNAHLMYNAHPKLFRHSFWCVDNTHDVFFNR